MALRQVLAGPREAAAEAARPRLVAEERRAQDRELVPARVLVRLPVLVWPRAAVQALALQPAWVLVPAKPENLPSPRAWELARTPLPKPKNS